MDIQPTNQQPISDDQELAKVLAGVNQQAEEAAATTPVDEPVVAPEPVAVEEPAAPVAPEPVMPDPIASTPAMPVSSTTSSAGGSLDSIKQDALNELRPLVDKLNVAPEEKFDTYLLLLRSTDDQALIEPAHEAARNITDEARRAQALLDIIKEIDYLSGPQQPTV
jgi:hypothetical protein